MKTLIKLGMIVLGFALILGTCGDDDDEYDSYYSTNYDHCTTHDKTYNLDDGCSSCNAGF